MIFRLEFLEKIPFSGLQQRETSFRWRQHFQNPTALGESWQSWLLPPKHLWLLSCHAACPIWPQESWVINLVLQKTVNSRGNIWNSANSQIILAIKSLRVANSQLFWSSRFKSHLMSSVDEITWRWYTAPWTKAKFEVKSLKRTVGKCFYWHTCKSNWKKWQIITANISPCSHQSSQKLTQR